MVRITGGSLKGRVIESCKSSELRPTTSFFREWIFNVLYNIKDMKDVVLLDLFSGTGAVSFEFVSRGAVSALMVEKERMLTELSQKNISKLNLSNMKILRSDSILFIKNTLASGSPVPYNMIFLDPPYDKPLLAEEILSDISAHCSLFSEELIIIAEHAKDKELKCPEKFTLLKEKASGASKMSVFGRNNA